MDTTDFCLRSADKTTVPVLHFDGALDETYLKSLDLNIRDKLPIARKDMFEAAFLL